MLGLSVSCRSSRAAIGLRPSCSRASELSSQPRLAKPVRGLPLASTTQPSGKSVPGQRLTESSPCWGCCALLQVS